jgi:hypothetical protein
LSFGSPPQKQKPAKGYRNPLKALFTSPSGKFFHDFLQKVRVVLLVISVPFLFAVQRIAFFGENVHILYVAETPRDSGDSLARILALNGDGDRYNI